MTVCASRNNVTTAKMITKENLDTNHQFIVLAYMLHFIEPVNVDSVVVDACVRFEVQSVNKVLFRHQTFIVFCEIMKFGQKLVFVVSRGKF